LRIRSPRNEFPLAKPVFHSLLLAGGIGITPLLAMAHQLWLEGSPFTLHYSARNPQRAAFASTIRTLPYARQVRFHWSEASGRADFSRLMRDVPHGTHAYVCGPSRFTQDAATAFRAAGRPISCWHAESFGV
jgi:vanillate O-demethylase ferredoxin subunit